MLALHDLQLPVVMGAEITSAGNTMQIPAIQHEAGEITPFVVELGHGSVTQVPRKLSPTESERSGENRPCLGDQTG
jgi:hypothetical protein